MKIKKKRLIAILLIAFLIYLISVFKDILIKTIVDAGATQITGADIRIRGLSFDIFDSSIHIRGLQIYNPQGFPKEVLIDIPKIEVEYDLSALLRKNLYLPLVEIDLKELLVIKDKEGKLNVNSLKFAKKQEEPQAPAKEEAREAMPMRIDVLKLNIGRVVYKDFSAGEKPSVEVYDISIKGTYKNITSATQLVSLILAESLKQTAIKGAKVYGVAAIAGVAILPVGVASVLIGKDSVKADFRISYERVYKASLEAMDNLGDLISQDERAGFIKGKIQGSDVVVRISKDDIDKKINVIVSARKYMLPKPKVAEGLLYEISQKLK